MKEKLNAALVSIASGDVQAVCDVAEQIKALSRTEDGLFDTSTVDDKLFRAAGLVYPVYAAYETECNKKEGYPDLIAQMRTLNQKFENTDCFFATACYLDALIHIIENVSPQLYEYYSELVDMFKVRVNEAIYKYYRNGRFSPESQVCDEQGDIQSAKSDGMPQGSANIAWADQMIRDAIRLAGEKYVLLAEKYEAYI